MNKNSTALLIVIVGLLILWIGVTGKFDCFGGVLTCMLQKSAPPGQQQPPAAGQGAPPTQGAITPQVGVSNALARVNARLGVGPWFGTGMIPNV